MFEQTADGLPVFAICCASATESFYRSALNAMINAKLTGKMGGLFPNMHVQLPMRVSYILGFKTVRYLLDEKVDRSKMGDMQNLGLACVPGLAMTPFSSMLEACNAGHLNPEPLWRRWTRGIAWRSAREVIFGIGGQPACACRVILWAARWRPCRPVSPGQSPVLQHPTEPRHQPPAYMGPRSLPVATDCTAARTVAHPF